MISHSFKSICLFLYVCITNVLADKNYQDQIKLEPIRVTKTMIGQFTRQSEFSFELRDDLLCGRQMRLRLRGLALWSTARRFASIASSKTISLDSLAFCVPVSSIGARVSRELRELDIDIFLIDVMIDASQLLRTPSAFLTDDDLLFVST